MVDLHCLARDVVHDVLKTVMGASRLLRVLRWIEALKYFDQRVLDIEWGNEQIYRAVSADIRQAIGKLGSVELQALRAYLRCLRAGSEERFRRLTAPYRRTLYINAGVYPDDPKTYSRYCQYMLTEILPEISVVGVWFNWGEARIVKRFARAAVRVHARGLETYYCESHRWTELLDGKDVVVLTPFAQSVRRQYERRERLWPGRESVLPEFRLQVIEVPQQASLVPPRVANWFGALEDLKRRMSDAVFDVALIGAGAFSLPLAVHAKRLGRCGIHLGGDLQAYFGIRSRRIDKHPVVSKFVNEHWVRPLAQETPGGKDIIENGCYW